MNSTKKALIVIGSPKPGSSVSATLAAHIAESLSAEGLEIEVIRAKQLVKTDEGLRSFLGAFDAADAIVLVFPLYIDSLPAWLTKALESVSEHRRAAPADRQQRLLAVCQSGFPEASQNATALAICRLFCRQAGIEWAGGLAVGGGGLLAGRELKKMGGMARNVISALGLACSDLAAGTPVSHEATALMAKPLLPNWIYVVGGAYGWNQLAMRNRVLHKLSNQPHKR